MSSISSPQFKFPHKYPEIHLFHKYFYMFYFKPDSKNHVLTFDCYV